MSGGKILVLYDNEVYKETKDKGLLKHWGLSLYIEFNKRKILFDTGQSPDILETNINKLKVKIKNVEYLVISHYHYDHVGGLKRIIEFNPKIKVFLPEPLFEEEKKFAEAIKTAYPSTEFKFAKVKNLYKIEDNIYLYPAEALKLIEQGLILKLGEKQIVIITGCAHWGVGKYVRELKELKEFKGSKIELLIGGFHLTGKLSDEVKRIGELLLIENVEKTCPIHCSGEHTKKIFIKMWKDNCIEGGVGALIEI